MIRPVLGALLTLVGLFLAVPGGQVFRCYRVGPEVRCELARDFATTPIDPAAVQGGERAQALRKLRETPGLAEVSVEEPLDTRPTTLVAAFLLVAGGISLLVGPRRQV